MLSKGLAKKFIEKIKGVVPCDIAIINSKGIIISATDSDIIGKQKVNGLKAIKKVKRLEILNEKTEILIEIINPIYFFNKAIGAISITGEIENLKEYSNLVISFFELILEEQGSFVNQLILENNNERKNNSNYLINKIIDENMGEELLNTLLVYINKNGERNKVARELHIHRNTLNYRLNKIEEITNLKFNNYIDLKEYVIAYIDYFQNKYDLDN